jgi:hypothetical protein
MSAPCPRVGACPLFAQFRMKSSLAVWQSYYCEGDFERCERFKLVRQARPVPLELLPNGRMLDVPLAQLEPRHLR